MLETGDKMRFATRLRLRLTVSALAVLGFALLVGPGGAATTTVAAGTPVGWGCRVSAWGQCTAPSGLSGVTAVSAGFAHTLGLRSDGTVAAWGCGGVDRGQCTVPSGLSGVTRIAAGGAHSLALKGDGTVVAWGCVGLPYNQQCIVPGGLTGVVAIAAGAAHSLAVKGDGTVVAWGCGTGHNWGQCTVPAGLSGVVAVAAGQIHSLALKSDGTVIAWGCGTVSAGECDVPAGLSGVTAIAAGDAHSLALKNDGTVVAWGCGFIFGFGQCAVPSGLSGVTAIAAGYAQSVALKSDGTVVTFGCGQDSDDGQCSVPSGLTGATAVAAGVWHSVALITPLSQTITFGTLGRKTLGDHDFTVTATASSGLDVSFTASGSCSIDGARVHLRRTGLCAITATQNGDDYHHPAPNVTQSFRVAPAPCRVPRVVGMRLSKAKRAIAKRHCRTGKVRRASRPRHRGVVISQSRRPGLKLPPGAKINLVVG